MFAFRLTAENALLFFEICQEIHADTEAQRISVLNAMVKLGKVDQVTQTTKTKEEYIKHLSKHFKLGIVQDNGSISSPPNKGNDPKENK